MSDGTPRDSAVFGGLDAFDDNSVDADAMDRMLLNLAATTDPPDWQLDALGPDFYSSASAYPSLPLDSDPPVSSAPQTAAAALSHIPLNNQSSHSQPQLSAAQRQPAHTPEHSPTDRSKSPPAPSNISPKFPATPPVVQGNPRKRPSPNSSRSPASAGSSAKPKVPTAVCPLCGKSISTNGANFRRHEQACRRARGDKVSAARPPTSPAIAPPTANGARDELGGASTTSVALTRRDSDLLNVVRRLEKSIGTLDVSARLCLRDALVSLSNKAANPNIPPTPQQEAMNRAAEYLVLRMLFLSGQQVMHTAPGTAGPYQEAMGLASRTATENNTDVVMSRADTDDGTVAASTGTGGATVAASEGDVGAGVRTQAKTEDKMADGT